MFPAFAEEISRPCAPIVDKRDGRDDPDRAAAVRWRARKRVRDALPKRIATTLEQGRELVKQAKGLK